MGTIQLKSNATAAKIPTANQLVLGELAINTADGKLYLKTNAGAILCVGQAVNGDWDVANLSCSGTFAHKTLAGGKVGFFGTTPSGKPSVTGSTGGNLVLQRLCGALGALGLITNNTTA